MVVVLLMVALAAGAVTFVPLLWSQGFLIAFIGSQLAASLGILLAGVFLAFQRRDSAESSQERPPRSASGDRKAARLRTFRRGRLEWNGGHADCIVQDRSETGARLRISESTRTPELVDLWFIEHDRANRVQVRWRTPDEIGVQFLENAQSPSQQPTSVPAVPRRAG